MYVISQSNPINQSFHQGTFRISTNQPDDFGDEGKTIVNAEKTPMFLYTIPSSYVKIGWHTKKKASWDPPKWVKSKT